MYKRQAQHGAGSGIGDQVIGLDLTGDECLAQPVGRVDDHPAAVAAHRVGSEEHPGDLGRHEQLYDGGQRDDLAADPGPAAVLDGPCLLYTSRCV